jgi:hypothetical protein
MVSKTVKVLVVIACLSVGILAILFAPIVPTTFRGTEIVQYDSGVDQINLIVNSDVANIYIDYANETSADLINLSYYYLIGHALLLEPPAPQVDFTNSTSGTVLTVNIDVNFPNLVLSSTWTTITQLTINPTLLTNLTITCATANIDVETSHSINKTFVEIDLLTETGNIDVAMTNESTILGDLLVKRTTGNAEVIIGKNSEIVGNLQVNSTTGNADLILIENATLNNDFIVKTTTGNINVYLNNISLNNNEIQGFIQALSGNLEANIVQELNPMGNLTLKMISSSGNARLPINLEADYLSSEISYQTGSGSININTNPPGYDTPTPSVMTSSAPDRSSNFDVDIITASGNINIIAARN